jgi:hypothetical protein
MGNHEYYYERVLRRARKEAADTGVHLLENDQVIIDKVRFLDATVWKDFEVEAPEHDGARSSRITVGISLVQVDSPRRVESASSQR